MAMHNADGWFAQYIDSNDIPYTLPLVLWSQAPNGRVTGLVVGLNGQLAGAECVPGFDCCTREPVL